MRRQGKLIRSKLFLLFIHFVSCTKANCCVDKSYLSVKVSKIPLSLSLLKFGPIFQSQKSEYTAQLGNIILPAQSHIHYSKSSNVDICASILALHGSQNFNIAFDCLIIKSFYERERGYFNSINFNTLITIFALQVFIWIMSLIMNLISKTHYYVSVISITWKILNNYLKIGAKWGFAGGEREDWKKIEYEDPDVKAQSNGYKNQNFLILSLDTSTLLEVGPKFLFVGLRWPVLTILPWSMGVEGFFFWKSKPCGRRGPLQLLSPDSPRTVLGFAI